MLTTLSIRNVVLIEKLDLSFKKGLCVFTGETGAGKSILLDALGLAIGERADTGLLRKDGGEAVVTATFEVASGHPVIALLRDHGIETDDIVILRRTLSAAGRTRAFVNDQATSVGFLKQVGALLIEVQGQFAQQGLLDSVTHLPLLDAFGGLQDLATETARAYRTWHDARGALDRAKSESEQARQDEDYLRHALEELDKFDPHPDEDAELSHERQRLMQASHLVEAVNAAQADMKPRIAVTESLRSALRRLERVAESADGQLDEALAALDRALDEVETAADTLNAAGRAIEIDDARLSATEERLFALRELARKHRVDSNALPALRQGMQERLALIDNQTEAISALTAALAKAREHYLAKAERLSQSRIKAASRLDKAVQAELAPLKLERAIFTTLMERLPEDSWHEDGIDRASFTVATNPGETAGPIGRIASGGELSRFMLAIKVSLATMGAQPSLVFDEVDSGIGGATAHAVGERLRRLADQLQVLVVTHSPQVAARGADHLRVHKDMAGGRVTTGVERLTSTECHEELARMLSGAAITEEARAAARRLMEGHVP
ncbi:MAG: DNA repair protein RecN [Proteobacteria bacterium]|nr:DNA repair protein RecN [Pseudomonadota bacterium]